MTTAAACQPARLAARPPTAEAGPFAAAQAVADAVLYEGYLLYPYRKSSPKNRVRWQFGVLAPRSWIDAQGIADPAVAGSAESWFQQAECLAEAPRNARLRVRLRFLQVRRRECFAADADGISRPVDELGAGTATHLTFDEGLPREIDVAWSLAELIDDGTATAAVSVPAEHLSEDVSAANGRAIGHIEHTTLPVTVRLIASVQRADAPFPLLRVTVRVENAGDIEDPRCARTEILRRSLIASHLLLGLDDGAFLSLLDPPEWAQAAADGCVNRHVFPVLAGADDGPDAVLCSPIILYDHPRVAPESPGDLHDAVEIDEILSLRTLTLTDAEKREARATDPRAAEIVDRVDTMPPEMLAKLHGAVRGLRQTHEELPDHVLVAGHRVGVGDRVRLRPRAHGTDAHDMFFAGKVARVRAVLHDVDGSIRVAVTAEDDPAAELREWYGRFFHFTPDEVEPIGDEP